MSNAFKLRNGTILLSTEAPGGIYNAAQLKKIASLCEGETAIVKATEDQRLALCVKPEQAADIANELNAIGLGIRHYQDGLHHPTSCIGELCPDHEQDALGSALDISQQLEAVKLASPLKIGINGCARCCVPCHTLDISVVGDAAGYRMHLGGKNSQLPEMASFMAEAIPAPELPKLILKVIELYKQHTNEGESLQEVIERVGSAEFIAILAPYSQDAAGDADPFSGSTPELLVDDAPPEDTTPELVADEAPQEETLALVENENLTMDSGDHEDEDFSLVSDSTTEVDIDPNALGDGFEVSSEVEISPSETMSGPEIALSDDFGTDSIEDIHAPSDEGAINAAAVELEAMPEDDLFLNSEPLELEEISEVKLEEITAEPELTAVETEAETLEGEEDTYEKQLNASIAAQEQLVDQSSADDDRENALDLLDDTSTSLDDSEFVAELEMMSGNNEEENIDDELFVEEDLSQINMSQLAEVSADELDEFEDSITDPRDHLPLSEVVGTANRPLEPTPIRQSVMQESAKAHKKSSAGWSFAGLDVDVDSNPVLSFSNGVQITLTEDAVANGAIMIGGRQIVLTSVNGGIEMQMDGMKMFLPKAA